MSIRRSATLMVAIAILAALIAVVLVALPVGAQEEKTRTPVDPGAGTNHIGPELWGTLQNHADGGTVAQDVRVKLHARDDLTPTVSLSDAITSAGGTHVAGGVWEMPTSKTLAIIQREDIYRATLESPTATTNPRIDATLNDIIVALAGTVPAEAAVQYSMFTHEDGVVVEAHVPTAKMATAVRNWAAQQDIYVPATTDVHGDAHNFAFLIPADKIAPLMAYHTVDLTLTTGRIKGHSAPLTRSRWSEGARKTEQAIVAPYLPGYVRPASPEEGVTGAAPVWGTELTEKLKRHGMYRWHNDYQYQGLGVTIGIID